MTPLFLLVQEITPRLITLVLAALPVSELRGAIPYAIVACGMSWQEAYIIAVIGNFIPVIPLLFLFESVSNYLMRYRLFNRFFTWLFERTRRKGRLIERFEAVGLVLFVAVPLPVTGAWTGCVAAFIFKVPLKYAIPAVLLGIMIAGTVVTLASLGVIQIWGIG
ncbi:MAG: small multi-drug export protein [Candidatus Krumholzibacteria bacterium]|nr:small multi-drug export protein [Candidatus Krumholzibacteria bacterium]